MHEKLSQRWNSVSLRTKITGVTVLLVTLGLLVAGVGTLTVLRNYLMSEADRKVVAVAIELNTIAIGVEGTCERSIGPGGYFVAMLTEDGGRICTNRSSQQPQPDVSVLSLDAVNTLALDAITLWDDARTQQWRIVAIPY